MDLELAGTNGTWAFGADAIRIRYLPKRPAHKLLRRLGELVVPERALAGVTFTGGRKEGVLRLEVRPGACPLTEAAAGQLPEKAEPYRLVVTGDKQELAEYYAGYLRDRIALNPDADRPSPEYLVFGPPPPLTFEGEGGYASFDGKAITFSRGQSGKRDRTFDLADVEGVDWIFSDWGTSSLRVRLRDSKPATMVFGEWSQDIDTTLPFAAAVRVALAELRTTKPTPKPLPAAPAVPEEPLVSAENVLATLRSLGELRDAGVLSEDEFQRKKTELLRRL
ncbi:DUF4429 domain-containing protein [Nocardia sp. CDC159]|uniref:DUF4429 domain-containing protein n=1 Tax=Nocardia pulmonis TaxID=2951408 RepID=A0A9X2EA47_9NOCA|nr:MULTISPECIES: DUF4429 domain-containing protein [Nocardia]MCM6775623.1 DUF4429 domain-containing protein [Nocardia pulmonis]MCM6787643.1 DUF4429 domain-containing protein [Nocardia sp. CDC159]